jgi:hypothetical protein
MPRYCNQLIHKIKDYLPNEKIQFNRNKLTRNLEIIFENKNAIMTILESDTWEQNKRYIDHIMSNEKSEVCFICSTNKIQKKRISCNKCAGDYCIDCYISIFRTNKGIIICPFCRYSIGVEFPECMIEFGVQNILESCK